MVAQYDVASVQACGVLLQAVPIVSPGLTLHLYAVQYQYMACRNIYRTRLKVYLLRLHVLLHPPRPSFRLRAF